MGLLVMDSQSEAAYRQCGVKVTASLADASWVPFQVRKLQMKRGEDGYGFLMKEEKSSSGKRGKPSPLQAPLKLVLDLPPYG